MEEVEEALSLAAAQLTERRIVALAVEQVANDIEADQNGIELPVEDIFSALDLLRGEAGYGSDDRPVVGSSVRVN